MKSVVHVERLSVLIVAIVVLLALAVPASRIFTIAAIKRMSLTGDKNVWVGRADPAIPGPKTDSQLARENSKDYLLRLGIAMSSRYEARDSAFDALIRDFPREPSAYAFAMNARRYSSINAPNRIEQWGVTPERAARVYKDMREQPWYMGDRNRKDDLRQIHRLLSLLDAGSRIDPDNGFFKRRKAICLFALHRDDEALEELHQAAIVPRFTRYEDMLTKATARLWALRGGFDPIGRWSSGQSLDPMTSKDRDVAEIVEHLAFMKIKRGNVDGGVKLAMDGMRLGHRLAATSSNSMDALLGIAHFELAAAALDPLCDMTVIKDKAERRRLSDSNLRLRRSFDFLTSRGYVAEAGLLKRWARDCDRLSDALRKSMDATGPGSTTEFLTVSSVYVQAFRNGARLLTICGLAFLLWLVTGLFTYRKRFDGLWDRRAAMSASLTAALPLAVILELFVEGATDPARGMSTLMGNLLDAMSGDHVMSKMLGISFARVAVPLHWSLIVVMMGCGIIGLIVALRRASQQGRRISIPAAALIPAYVALFGLIAEDSYNSHLSSRDVVGAVDWRCLIAPLVLLVIYGTFRAASWSFGQARQSGPMVFLATLRYGSALVAAIFAVAYAVLLPVTVIDSRRAENMSHTLGRAEASVIHNALR